MQAPAKSKVGLNGRLIFDLADVLRAFVTARECRNDDHCDAEGRAIQTRGALLQQLRVAGQVMRTTVLLELLIMLLRQQPATIAAALNGIGAAGPSEG